MMWHRAACPIVFCDRIRIVMSSTPKSDHVRGIWRLSILVSAGVLLLVLAGLSNSCVAAETDADKPNVIVVITDDQGYGDMSCHGNPFLQTPQIDQLASASVQLTNFHVDPTCSPSRAALMTGRYSSRVGV